MSYTAEEASWLLSTLDASDPAQAKAALTNLIAEISVKGSGSITVLYYGTMDGTENGVKTNTLAKELSTLDSRVRIVDKTEAGIFLDLDKNPLLAQKLNQIFGFDQIEIAKYLYGTKTGEVKGIWDGVSERFVSEAVGEIRVIAPHACQRIFIALSTGQPDHVTLVHSGVFLC